MLDHRPECSISNQHQACRCAIHKFLNDASFHELVQRLSLAEEALHLDLDTMQQAVCIADELFQKRKIR